MKIRMPPGRPRERKEKKVRVLTVLGESAGGDTGDNDDKVRFPANTA